jgi:hypothetical protein
MGETRTEWVPQSYQIYDVNWRGLIRIEVYRMGTSGKDLHDAKLDSWIWIKQSFLTNLVQDISYL